ncbi:uncharacterized protein KQ657_005177 [Scheffersomyces spartinae]|uniref:4-hydroxyphenylpyruvate dioxygenase n=1 Tax=Scheffersomyces spartinae TaxID=45513 RepID=A0A9P8AI31_9ASCO|nr:uncharacterized protein KQ657_005177 [Scheffersomyces spartinae]KAG7193978.1 hypothetical protein KQ657_005177 [Scheffersomyces spartinae]
MSYDHNLLVELPYYPYELDPFINREVNELLSKGHMTFQEPIDGFIGFHHLKLCTANAKQLASFFVNIMDFEEIAYKGLESGSKLLASHVVRNGNVTFELVNTLISMDQDQELCFPLSGEDFAALLKRNGKFAAIKDHLRHLTKAHVEDIVTSTLFELQGSSLNPRLKETLTTTIKESESYQNTMAGFDSIIDNLDGNIQATVLELMQVSLIQKFLKYHNDGVYDIALNVVNVEDAFQKAIKGGALVLAPPTTTQGNFGWIKSCTVALPGVDICHTLIECTNYHGRYLPGYIPSISEISEAYLNTLTQQPPVRLLEIDHCVENYGWNEMMKRATLYANMFGLHRFWSVDEADVSTTLTSLRSIVMASANGKVKIPINEPAEGLARSQIEEFNDYNNGPGVQHIALRTLNIISAVAALKARGVEFNGISPTYYENLRKRMELDDVVLKEDINELAKLNILVDYDASTRTKKKLCNYILQIFTKPLHDRPTLFLEIIQRRHHNGFGKGTFKGLFETIEMQQRRRGTLFKPELKY